MSKRPLRHWLYEMAEAFGPDFGKRDRAERAIRKDPRLPKPVRVGGRRYYEEGVLIAYRERLEAEAAQQVAYVPTPRKAA